MDELDLLKRDWKKQEKNLPHLSYDEIYKMLWKKSSSVVRWIFVISILELFVSTILSIFFVDDAYWENMERLGLTDFNIGLYLVSYGVTFYFIYRFYKNYQRISATDDAATLMRNILKTRKTVKTYIAYVLIFTGVSSLVVSYFTIQNHALTTEVQELSKYEYDTLDWIKFVLIITIFLAIFLSFIWLFYRLIYGILLRRLNRNYQELKRLEMD